MLGLQCPISEAKVNWEERIWLTVGSALGTAAFILEMIKIVTTHAL